MEDHNGNNAESAAAKAGATSASGDTYYARTENSVSWTIPVDATSSKSCHMSDLPICRIYVL